MKVLLVGVNADWEIPVTKLLGQRGHQQIVAVDAASALIAVAHDTALIVVEDPLPDMAATGFCRAVRSRPGGADAVILVITSRDDQLPDFLEAGATDLYTTSLGPAALEARVLIAESLVLQQSKLKDRELRFRRLFDSGVAGVTISDLDGNFKEANAAFLKMLGYTHADMLAGELNWETITPLDRLVGDIEDRAQLRATGFLPLREREFVHKDGRYIATLVGAAALQGTTECISYVTDISTHKQAEVALRASATQYRTLFEHSPLPMFLYDHETLRHLAVNAAALALYGHSREEFLQMSIEDLAFERTGPQVPDAISHGETGSGSYRHKKQSGTVVEVDITVQKFVFDGRPCGLTIAIDTTDRNRLDLQLRQAQKMDAIGNLAGGIAHDFNNLLSVILSYSKMLAEGLNRSDPMRADLDEISRAGMRAAELTRQLLAFSRQQILDPKILDLNGVTTGIAKMLQRLMGEDVELNVVACAGLGLVRADPGQVEQVLVNLVVNARDAMPTGGKLTIETANVELDATYAAKHTGVQAGSYVMLAVTDNGTGMAPAIVDRMFDPFFTTKELGRGTGLGLSTVFGIVQQTGGTIWVYSEVGAGTTIKVYLPRCDGEVLPDMEIPYEAARRASETILLVEDEESVRLVTRTILERTGYRVLEAKSGGDALLICEQHTATIHLLLTDVVMPRMSGRTLAERLSLLRPTMKIVYMSGYTDDAIVRHGILESDVEFLQKPITPDALTTKLREVLAAPPLRRSASPPARGDSWNPETRDLPRAGLERLREN